MADKIPNYQVEIKRLQVENMTLRLNIERNALRIMEMEDEIRRLQENSEATEVAIQENEKKLAMLVKAHGKEVGDG